MQRKLTAILSADVAGYSALMSADEAGTLDRLKVNRARIFDPQVAIHGGRVFKLIGDGALAEFPSVIAAVECALAIQAGTEKAAQGETESKPIRYRIGINLGEVIVEGDDIYGEGVNVAARLQTLAPIGGVALSRLVKDQVDGKAACSFEDMGQHQVKDHDKPVHAFSAWPAQAKTAPERASKAAPASKISVCVLPFANMSGDLEQEYFSDGISEDIITDLSKVSALGVVSRNTAFTYKGKNVKVRQVANELNVTHVLEGSVRKSGGRVRITAQLIDGANDEHVWADRYDRDLSDIFALQDEISEAIVKALRLKLLPEEKKAIEARGTDNVEAYNLYLMARQTQTGTFSTDKRRNETIVRMCRRALELDPGYARAWALMAVAQADNHNADESGDGGQAAVERALALDPSLAEAHAVKARLCFEKGLESEALQEIAQALRLDPESYDVHTSAAGIGFRRGEFQEALGHYEKCTELAGMDFGTAGMMITCCSALGDAEGVRRAAELTRSRCEAVLSQDRSNGSAMGHLSVALGVLGQGERAKEWMNRALLVDPDQLSMRYNFACALANFLKDTEAALVMIGPFFERVTSSFLHHLKVDPDLDPIRDDPRFQAMVAAAEKRLAKSAAG